MSPAVSPVGGVSDGCLGTLPVTSQCPISVLWLGKSKGGTVYTQLSNIAMKSLLVLSKPAVYNPNNGKSQNVIFTVL